MSDPTRVDVELPEPPAAGGWGSLKAVTSYLTREDAAASGTAALAVQNKPGGFMCTSCAWAKPARPSLAEFCENGAKATAWELTGKRRPPAFFLEHTLHELERWTDHELEVGGRLTAPMRWDAATDRYLEVGWDEAFAEIGAELRQLPPASTVFYTSGRASLEASYLYQLFARLYGHNNLPDSSNMCHESTSVALPQTIGSPVGTVWLDDFEHADCVFFFGQNVGVSSPRMLHPLQEARRRGVPIVTFNPLRESGLVAFDNPQSPHDMLMPGHTAISTQYLQLRPGGDIAALSGLCKWLIEADDAAQAQGAPRVLDAVFIAEHTRGFDELAAALRPLRWHDIERESGLARADLERAAATFARARAVIGVYGMGLTQHREGVLNVQMLSNLLLLGGHIGKPGAGICPVRGHSNVQGQRTVGITEKPELAPLAKLQALYGFVPPQRKGRATVETCEGLIDGSVRAFIGLGGNFLRAVPETQRVEAAWRKLRLSVQVATKLNRSHVVHAEVSYLLPCLGRIEIDRQAGGEQMVSLEDSTGHIHASRGVAEPASTQLLSEIAIVARLAEASLAANERVRWRAWADDYALIRDEIAQALPEVFHDFNARVDVPGGFARPMPARERIWKTPSGKAHFVAPTTLSADPAAPADDVLRLMTLRSDDQFNTTVYSDDDRFRRVHGTRRVLLMNPQDIARLGLREGARVTARSVTDDGVLREVGALAVRAYAIPPGAVGGYYPELNALIPLWHHAKGSHVPAAKSIPVRLVAEPVRSFPSHQEYDVSAQPNAMPVPFDPSVEHIDEKEAEVAQEIQASMEKIREKTYAGSGHALRSVHAKLQGVLRATLTVEPGLPETLAQGLFAQPGGYEALMRFSTIPGDILDDKVSVPRGLALKVLGVSGERLPGSEADSTQNFVMADAPAFNAPNTKKFSSSLKQLAATTDRAEGAKKVLSAVLQATEQVVEAFGGKSAKLISMGGHPPTHVLGASFYSAAALRHGRYIAKLAVVPVSPELKALEEQKIDLDDRPNGLREEVVAFMQGHRAEWAVQVQLCTDLEAMPVEDASVDWPQDRSPYVTVARLVAEPQTAYSDALASAVDDTMFFSPWRGLSAHQPLGNVMRARKEAYEQSARYRAERNGRPVVEPTDLSGLPA